MRTKIHYQAEVGSHFSLVIYWLSSRRRTRALDCLGSSGPGQYEDTKSLYSVLEDENPKPGQEERVLRGWVHDDKNRNFKKLTS